MCRAAASVCRSDRSSRCWKGCGHTRTFGTPDTVSYYSAAAVHAFKLPGSLAQGRSTIRSGLLHLTRAGSAAPRRKGVVGHRAMLEPDDIVILQGVPVTSIPRTLLDLAGTGARRQAWADQGGCGERMRPDLPTGHRRTLITGPGRAGPGAIETVGARE